MEVLLLLYSNWLQVFRSADAARMGQRARYAQKNVGFVVAARGPDMRLTAIFLVRIFLRHKPHNFLFRTINSIG